MLHTFFFLLGFSIIFIALGFSSSFIGNIFNEYQNLIRQIGAIFIVLFGLIVTGILSPEFLMKERRIAFKNRPSGFIGSILIGIAFAAGWMPCTGPILAAVWTLAAANPGSGMVYMIAYLLGFAIPFLPSCLSLFGKMNWIRKHNVKIVKIGGIIMILMGILLFFDGLTLIISLFSSLFGDFTGILKVFSPQHMLRAFCIYVFSIGYIIFFHFSIKSVSANLQLLRALLTLPRKSQCGFFNRIFFHRF